MGHLSHFMRATLLGFALAMWCTSALAACKVTFVATIANRPALLPAMWSISRLDNPLQPTVILDRHSGTLNLPAGQYRAVVNANQQSKETQFRVESEQDIVIRVALD